MLSHALLKVAFFAAAGRAEAKGLDPSLWDTIPTGRPGFVPMDLPQAPERLSEKVPALKKLSFTMDPAFIPTHAYEKGAGKVGLVYTCRGGFVDVGHLRKSMDWTAYIHAQLIRALREGKSSFEFQGKEPSVFRVELDPPLAWKVLTPDQREEAAASFAPQTAAFLAYGMLSWHEVITWYGWSVTYVITERTSAFSYEDNFSNLMGAQVAARAIANPTLPYNEAANEQLAKDFAELVPQSEAVAHKAFARVKGNWWVGNRPLMAKSILKREVNLGFETPIVPWRVSGLEECEGSDAATLSPDLPASWIRLTIDPRTPQLKKLYGKGKIPARLNWPEDVLTTIEPIRQSILKDIGPAAFDR